MCSVSNWKSLDKKRFCFRPGLQIWKMYFHSLFPFQGYIQRGNISIAIITWKIPHHEITLHCIRSQNFWTSSVSQCYCFPLKVMYDYLSSWLPQVRKKSGKNKFLQGKGKVREFHFEPGNLWKKAEKSEVIHLDFKPSFWWEMVTLSFLWCLRYLCSLFSRVDRFLTSISLLKFK